jgi:hypothetical protein
MQGFSTPRVGLEPTTLRLTADPTQVGLGPWDGFKPFLCSQVGSDHVSWDQIRYHVVRDANATAARSPRRARESPQARTARATNADSGPARRPSAPVASAGIVGTSASYRCECVRARVALTAPTRRHSPRNAPPLPPQQPPSLEGCLHVLTDAFGEHGDITQPWPSDSLDRGLPQRAQSLILVRSKEPSARPHEGS